MPVISSLGEELQYYPSPAFTSYKTLKYDSDYWEKLVKLQKNEKNTFIVAKNLPEQNLDLGFDYTSQKFKDSLARMGISEKNMKSNIPNDSEIRQKIMIAKGLSYPYK